MSKVNKIGELLTLTKACPNMVEGEKYQVIDNDDDINNTVYTNDKVYPVIINSRGVLGLQDNLGETSCCNTGDIRIMKVESAKSTELVTKESSYTIKLSGYRKSITEQEAKQLRDELNTLLGE